MIECDVCNKLFKRKDNMLRHKRNIHQDENSDNESELSDHMDADSDTVSDTDATSSEEHEKTIDPWYDILKQTFRECQPKFKKQTTELMEDEGVSEDEARKTVYRELLSQYRKVLISKYVDRITWFESLKRDPVHKAVQKTAKRLREDDDFDPDESYKYAAKKRMYLFDKILKEFTPPEINGNY